MIARLSGCLALLALGGCASQTLPPRLPADLLALNAATHFPLTVGVEKFALEAYSEDLISQLRRTGLFDRVDYVDRLAAPPDIIAKVENGVSGTAVIPVLTLLTLGIIPTTVTESWGTIFSLRSRLAPNESVGVNFHYQGRTTLGWVAVLLNLSPDRGLDAQSSRRFTDALRASIAEHTAEIRAMVQR